MKDNRSQYNSSVSIILISILVIGVGIYLMSGLSRDVKDLKIQYATAKKENDLLVQKKKDLDQAITTIQTKDKEISLFKQAMPLDAQLSEAFAQTDNIIGNLSASGSGAAVKNFTIGAPADADGKIPVNLTIDTDLSNLIRITKLFHDNLRPFVVDTINISAKDSPVFSSTMTMGLTYVPASAQAKEGQSALEDNQNLKEELNAK